MKYDEKFEKSVTKLNGLEEYQLINLLEKITDEYPKVLDMILEF